jgi:hypothetical protein
MHDPNLTLLENVALLLQPILADVVFVGGCATGLLITDSGASAVRKTYDVDVIAEIASYLEYSSFSERLKILGFQEDSRKGAPLCRWVHSGYVLDVMPLDPGVLGFSNPWYAGALANAHEVTLPSQLKIRAITAPYFIATKIEAFRSRGNNDFFASHDLEDIITVVDGRPSIVEEVSTSDPRLKDYVGATIKELLTQSRFLDALPGFLLPDSANQQRALPLLQRLRLLSSVP